MKPAVGLIGLGLMGRPMGQNLLKAGFALMVWNRTEQRGDELVRLGARRGNSPRDVAAKADVVLTMVSDPPALEEILWGREGALGGLRRGSVLVDSSRSTLPSLLTRRPDKWPQLT